MGTSTRYIKRGTGTMEAASSTATDSDSDDEATTDTTATSNVDDDNDDEDDNDVESFLTSESSKSSENFQPEDYYSLNDRLASFMTKFGTEARIYKLDFQNRGTIKPRVYPDRLVEIVESIMSMATKNLEGHDMVRLYITSDSWKRPINMPYMRYDELTGKRILHEFMKSDQSNGALGLDNDGIEIDIITTKLPGPGSGWSVHGSCNRRIYIN